LEQTVTEFLWPLRVYYEDTDSGGVVYYANYLRFMERARTEWLRALGFEQDALARDAGVIFAVRHAEIDFRKPARFNDALVVRSTLAELGRASVVFDQTIARAGDAAAALCTGRIRVACLAQADFRPTGIPARMLEELQRVR
jgi:acyl-CoA thioester hydrolase